MNGTARTIMTLLMCAAARTGFCAGGAGTGVADFLKLPVDARTAGMGEAVAASAAGGMMIFQNPAALSGAARGASAFSHALLAGGLSYDVIGAVAPLGFGGAVGGGVQYLTYGRIQSLDNTGDPAGTLSPRDLSVSLGYGGPILEKVSLGFTVKSITSRISRSASVSAMDFGLLAGDERVSVGAAVHDLGGSMKFNRRFSPLPARVKLGGSLLCGGKWRLSADLNLPEDAAAWAAAGVERFFDRETDPGWEVFARAGYNTAAWDTGGVNGFSAGFGLARDKVGFDYALKTMGMLGVSHFFTLNYRFDR